MKNTDDLSRSFLKQANKINPSATQNFDLWYSEVLKGIGQRSVRHAVSSLPSHVRVRKQRPITVIYLLQYQK